jgi:hypothetical protein
MPSYRCTQAARARRTVVWTLGFVLVAQVVTCWLLDFTYPLVRFPSLEQTVEVAKRQPRSPDIIALGSSRLGAGFREQQIEKELRQIDPDVRVFNACVEGADPYTMDVVLQHLLAAGMRPKLAVIEVSPETLAAKNRWLKFNMLRMMNWRNLDQFVSYIPQCGGGREFFMTRCLPLICHRQMILETLLMKATGTDRPRMLATSSARPEQDWDKLKTCGVPWEEYMARAKNKGVEPSKLTQAEIPFVQNWLRDYHIANGRAAQALDRVLTQCKEYHIDVVLIAIPVAAEQRKLYEPPIEAEFQSHLQQVTAKFGCRWLDYRSRIDNQLFQDNHHLMLEGAKVFSKELTSKVLAPKWQETQAAKKKPEMTEIQPAGYVEAP